MSDVYLADAPHTRNMRITRIAPISSPLWEQLLRRQSISVFHSPAWLRVLQETYDLDVGAYVLHDAVGQPVAGLPFCPIRDLKGPRLVALPFSDYCDPIAEDADQWRCLLDTLLAEEAVVIVRCLHSPLPLGDPRLDCYNRAKWHGLDLRPELDILWQGLYSGARQAIRKAQQNAIEIVPAQSKSDLRRFFMLHLEVRKYKYHLLAQPYRFFELIWEQFVETGSGLLLLARRGPEVIGGTFFLAWQGKLFYKFNASARNNLDVRPNDLLIWEGIVRGKMAGCTELDFGLSDWDQEGLIRYKRKFASEEKTISFLRSSAAATPTEQEQQVRLLLPRLTELLTDQSVPDAVTERAGDLLYRLFV